MTNTSPSNSYQLYRTPYLFLRKFQYTKETYTKIHEEHSVDATNTNLNFRLLHNVPVFSSSCWVMGTMLLC